MSFTRITNEDRNGKGNVGLPDTPLLTTTEMQEQMDSLPNLAIDKFNDFLTELEASTAAVSIGCEVPLGVISTQQTLQSVINAMGSLLVGASAQRHTHYNMEQLDSLTSDLVTALNDIAIMLYGITSVEASITDNAAAIPTSRAVMNYVANADIKRNIMNTVYPIGAIYQTTSTDPDTLFETQAEKWTLLSTSSDGIKTYKRTS